MLTNTALNPLNSLSVQCIRNYCNKFNAKPNFENGIKNSLNINIRQSIVDYVLREKVVVSTHDINDLINGGLFSFDLWKLTEDNDFIANDIIAIMDVMINNSNTFHDLVLGGSSWIYNTRVVRGPLRSLFKSNLNNLLSLKVQQIPSPEHLISIFKSCNRLRRLEICQPSITDRDINAIEDSLASCPVVNHLKELLLPSSLKSHALLTLLAIFPNIKTLKCAPFEQLIELIDSMVLSANQRDSQMAKKAAMTLSTVKSLTVTHPMGCDTIDRIVQMCPKLETLCLEIQEGMELSPISQLPNIRELELRNSPTMPASYTQQVLPILQTKGHQLQVLSLEQFDVIDLTTCAKLCPNLSVFSAQWFTTLCFVGRNESSSRRNSVKNPFSNLTHLRLRPRSQRNIPSDACAFALSFAKQLTHIELYCCYDLSDDDVQAIQHKNPMKHLRSLILRHGHNVTTDALNLLVSRAQELSFIDCGTPPPKKSDNDILAPDPQN